MRVILDTNILLSMTAAKSESFRTLRAAWRAGQFELLLSEELLAEVSRTLAKPKLQKIIPKARADRLVRDLDLYTATVEIRGPFPEAPDPDDAFLLAMLRDGAADVLVTGDKALLALGTWGGAAILKLSAFLRLLE